MHELEVLKILLERLRRKWDYITKMEVVIFRVFTAIKMMTEDYYLLGCYSL